MGGPHEAALVIAYCRAVAKKHRSRSDPQSWMNFVTDVVKPCITGVSPQGTFKNLQYRILYGHDVITGLCRSIFLSCYEISEYYLERALDGIKEGQNLSIPSLDKKLLSKKMKFEEIKKISIKNDLTISKDIQIGLAASNNTPSLHCISWMKYYFKLQADQTVRKEELHLECVKVRDIWKEYVSDMVYCKLPFYGYVKFIETWREAFPHVKIRKYKVVGGKCWVCALLSEVLS
jgi:hypothetical protein